MNLDELLPPTPKKDDVLFAGDRQNWPLDALLRPFDDYAYRQGYRRAGRILTEWAAEHREVDFLVYPICHAYRHYVELTLKRLILLGCRVVGRTMTTGETKLQSEKHDLRRLWNAFKGIADEVTNTTGDQPRPLEDTEGIEAYIDQLHEVDEGSFSFRYSVTTKGESTLNGLERINLGRFCDYMERLCNYLEGYDGYYGHLIQMENEMYDNY